MLLTRIRHRLRDDRGSTMVPAIGLLAVAAIITATVTVTTVHSLGFTSGNRAGVQARAAADAGVEFARALLEDGSCPPGGAIERSYGQIAPDAAPDEASRPYFDVQIQHRLALSGTWTNGCPSFLGSLLNYQVRVESTGWAVQPGVNGVSGFDELTVEAIFGWSFLEPTASTALRATGAAVYSHSAPSNSVNSFTLVPGGTRAPGMQFKSGNFLCTASTITGSVVVESGSAAIDSGCLVTGDLFASGSVNMPSTGKVDGSVVTRGNYTQQNAATAVGGSVTAGGTVRIQGTVGGGVTAGPATGASTFVRTGSVGGNLVVAGQLNADWICTSGTATCSASSAAALTSAPNVAGTVQYARAGLVAPTIPSVPNWVDFGYKASEWIEADGTPFAVVTLNPLLTSDCNWSWAGSTGIAKLQQALASGRSTIIDARLCVGGLSMWATIDPKLTADLVIFANGFEGGANTWSSATADPRRLWIITPDELHNASPVLSCLSGGITFAGNFRVASTVSATVYTPCTIENSSTTWRGQMYGGKVVMHGGVRLEYVPNGLPGVDLDTGTDSTGGILIPLPTLGSLGELEYYGDVASAGGG